MMSRCYGKGNVKYDIYGGRGIKVENRLHSFENFLELMGEKPFDKTLDRLDPNGNYEIGNIRWATIQEQNRNLRKIKNCSSKHKGVYWHKKSNKWASYIKVKGVRVHLGLFEDEDDAGAVYNSAAREQWGSDCFLNEV